VRRRDGQYRWFLIHYKPLRNEQGQIIRWYATGTDIEDRKQAEEQIRSENLALREEIDHASMFEEIVGSSEALHTVLRQVARVRRWINSSDLGGRVGKRCCSRNS
jgi:formate hydrogenlyase transcriptional activator